MIAYRQAFCKWEFHNSGQATVSIPCTRFGSKQLFELVIQSRKSIINSKAIFQPLPGNDLSIKLLQKRI